MDKELLHIFENANSIEISKSQEAVPQQEPEQTEEEEESERQYRKARIHDFLVFPGEEAYQKRLTRYTELWIFLNADKSYCLVKYNFYNKTQEKVLAKNVTFDEAITTASNHVYFLEKMKEKRN